jgi:hypothetical protein
MDVVFVHMAGVEVRHGVEPAGRSGTAEGPSTRFLALLGGLISMIFALLRGLVCNGTIRLGF